MSWTPRGVFDLTRFWWPAETSAAGDKPAAPPMPPTPAELGLLLVVLRAMRPASALPWRVVGKGVRTQVTELANSRNVEVSDIGATIYDSDLLMAARCSQRTLRRLVVKARHHGLLSVFDGRQRSQVLVWNGSRLQELVQLAKRLAPEFADTEFADTEFADTEFADKNAEFADKNAEFADKNAEFADKDDRPTRARASSGFVLGFDSGFTSPTGEEGGSAGARDVASPGQTAVDARLRPPDDPMAVEARALDVWRHWVSTMEKTQGAAADPASAASVRRRATIEARLREGYTVAALKDAISACRANAWNMGHNDHGIVRNDIRDICGDTEKLDRFLTLAQAQSKPALPQTRSRPSTGESPVRQSFLGTDIRSLPPGDPTPVPAVLEFDPWLD